MKRHSLRLLLLLAVGTSTVLLLIPLQSKGQNQQPGASLPDSETSASNKNFLDRELLDKLSAVATKIYEKSSFTPIVTSAEKQSDDPPLMNVGGLQGVRGQFFYATDPTPKNPNGFSPEQEQELRQAGIDIEKARSINDIDLLNSGRPMNMWLYLHTLDGASDKVRVRQLSLGAGQYFKRSQFLDGHRLLVEIGEPFNRHGETIPFVFDFTKDTFQRLGSFAVQFENIQFSPNLRYAAFLQGPDLTGDSHGGVTYLTIADLQTNQERIVATGDSLVAGSWMWADDDTLLFSYQPSGKSPDEYQFPFPRQLSASQIEQARQAFALAQKQTKLGQSKTPNIYRVQALERTPELLLANAWRPQPSPDGKHLAFFGPESSDEIWPLATDWHTNPHGVSLSVASMNGSGRKALNREDVTYPSIIWRNSSQILSLKTDRRNGGAWGVVAQYDIATDEFERLAALKALDGALEVRPLFEMPYFDDLEVSKDGAFLWVKTHGFGEKRADGRLERHESIWGVELDKGAIFLVGHVKDGWGLAWDSKDSTSPVVPTKVP